MTHRAVARVDALMIGSLADAIRPGGPELIPPKRSGASRRAAARDPPLTGVRPCRRSLGCPDLSAPVLFLGGKRLGTENRIAATPGWNDSPVLVMRRWPIPADDRGMILGGGECRR